MSECSPQPIHIYAALDPRVEEILRLLKRRDSKLSENSAKLEQIMVVLADIQGAVARAEGTMARVVDGGGSGRLAGQPNRVHEVCSVRSQRVHLVRDEV